MVTISRSMMAMIHPRNFRNLLLAALIACLLAPLAMAERLPSWRVQAEGEDEGEGSFDERVRDLQFWLRQREAERRESWGSDVVTPENPAVRRPSSTYFTDRGYDSQGFRRLNENTRFRLRGQEAWLGDDGHAGSLRRAGRPVDSGAEAEGESRPDAGGEKVLRAGKANGRKRAGRR